MSITDVKGIGPATVGILAKHGIRSTDDLAKTTLATLITVPGFSRLRAQQVIKDAKSVVRRSPKTTATKAPNKKVAVDSATKKSKKSKKLDKKDKKSGKKSKSKKVDKSKKSAKKSKKSKKSKKK